MNGLTQYYYELSSRPSKQTKINKNYAPIVEATKECLQAPSEHVSIYDYPLHYESQASGYQQMRPLDEPHAELWNTTQPLVVHEQSRPELKPQPDTYQGSPMGQGDFEQLMQAAVAAAMDTTDYLNYMPPDYVPVDQGMLPIATEPAQPDLEAMVQDVHLVDELMASDMIHAEIQHQMHAPQEHLEDMMQSAYAEHAHTFDQHVQEMEDQFTMQQQLFDAQLMGPFG